MWGISPWLLQQSTPLFLTLDEVITPDLECGVAPLCHSCADAAWHSHISVQICFSKCPFGDVYHDSLLANRQIILISLELL